MVTGSLLLRATIVIGVIVAAFFIVWERGLLGLVIRGDSSYLSVVILSLYGLASMHWLQLCMQVSREHDWLNMPDAKVVPAGSVGALLQQLVAQPAPDAIRVSGLLRALEDEVANRHALGHFLEDALLKLGLLGTIIGFILMLMPIGELREFDASRMQQVLSSMSGGMGVSLYTTLVGLITHLLLRAQYFLLNASTVAMVNGLARRHLSGSS